MKDAQITYKTFKTVQDEMVRLYDDGVKKKQKPEKLYSDILLNLIEYIVENNIIIPIIDENQNPVKTSPTKACTGKTMGKDAFLIERNRLVGQRFTKYFPGHGDFNGEVTTYATKTDTYHVVYDDSDHEEMKYLELLQYLPGHANFISTRAKLSFFTFTDKIH